MSIHAALEQLEKQGGSAWADAIRSLFHHIHHTDKGIHEVHHCGKSHQAIDQSLDYTITHCSHNLHRIDKKSAVGHATGKQKLDALAITIHFAERCDDGGWHLESGKLTSKVDKGNLWSGIL